MKADAELEPFVRLIEALEPWLEEVVLIGGWAHRLYRVDLESQDLFVERRHIKGCRLLTPTTKRSAFPRVLAEAQCP